MKNLLIVLALTFVVFACHTKKDQDKSGINDPVNITYNSVDSSVLSKPAKKEPVVVPAPKDTVSICIDSTKIDPKSCLYSRCCTCMRMRWQRIQQSVSS
jgi:hypothetical protein